MAPLLEVDVSLLPPERCVRHADSSQDLEATARGAGGFGSTGGYGKMIRYVENT